jgi:Mn-dependent DtxR family transcriptional regulator
MKKEWPLTERQQEVLRAIRELSSSGRAPTQEELGHRIGVRSTVSTRRFLGILEKKGCLRPRGFNKRRDIALTERGRDAIAA